ncbi:hypothetical protein [Thalassotalea sp. PLHSN55]|uniref:hypothetical protein n=1 Tax=Thalassotalea sp. PLHSN55 TaxID=3435888 RepID=UPI003F839DFE
MYIQPITRANNLRSCAGNNDLRKKSQTSSNEDNWLLRSDSTLECPSETRSFSSAVSHYFSEQNQQRIIEQRLNTLQSELKEMQTELASMLNNIRALKPHYQSKSGNDFVTSEYLVKETKTAIKEVADLSLSATHQYLEAVTPATPSSFAIAV